MLEQSWTPEQWAIVEDRVVFVERRIVWRPQTGQRDVDVVCQLVACLVDAIVYVRVLLAVLKNSSSPVLLSTSRFARSSSHPQTAVPGLLAERIGGIGFYGVQIALV